MGNFEAWHHNLQKRTKMVATCNWLHCFHYLIQIFVVRSCSLIANCFCNYVASNYSRSSRHLWYSLIIAQVLPQIWIACCLRWRWQYPYLRKQWASCQIRKIAGCACAGNAGSVFHTTAFKGNRGLAILACITARAWPHVPWSMSGSLTRGGGENVPGIPGACAPAIFRIWQEAHWTSIRYACAVVVRLIAMVTVGLEWEVGSYHSPTQGKVIPWPPCAATCESNYAPHVERNALQYYEQFTRARDAILARRWFGASSFLTRQHPGHFG